MIRQCRWLLPFVFLVMSSNAPVRGQVEEKWLLDKSLTISPAKAPVPALLYRLYPKASDRVEGNAVPMYLRFAHERNDASKRRLYDKPAEWNKLPMEKLPLPEVREFLDGYSYNLRQLELGARRRTADWSYSLDAGNPIGMLLPDAQEMRMHAPILVLKARMAAIEGHYADAIRTLETGYSFSQQVGEGPFLINGLVGIACAAQFSNCLLEVIERPDAPNLYWAIATIPTPLVDLRRANDLEQKLLEMQFPELADLDRTRTPEQWEGVLRRFRIEVQKAAQHDPALKTAVAGSRPGDPASKSPDLSMARKYLVEKGGMNAGEVESMSPAEVLVRYQVKFYHEYRDEIFKATYLPYPEARPLLLNAEKRIKDAPACEAKRVTDMFLPAITKVQGARTRLDRYHAALRIIEAIRLHAAANGGKLPARLDDIKLVPVPTDPATGKSFEYHQEGRTATLIGRIPGEPLQQCGLRYRLTLRE